MDHYADDLSQVIGALDLNNVSMFGFSAGGGEVVRYVGRHGSKCVARIGLISTVTPLMLRTDANPEGSPMETFDQLRARSVADRSQLYRDLAEGPMFGFDRPGAARSQGVIDAFWLRGMMGGHKNLYGAIAAFSETDFSEDLRKIDRPTLIVHGEDDQVAPAAASAEATQRLAPHGELKIYPGAPHGLLETHREQLNRDMLAFLRA
jgi:non-heme chloroperoxidase